MGIFSSLFSGNNDSNNDGNSYGYGDLNPSEISLLDEADWVQDGQPFHEPCHIAAFPDEGAIYINPSEGDGNDVSFHYADRDQGNHDLLTHFNSNWSE